VEYHFLTWRELYDNSIITVDRYSSDAAEWVLRGDRHFYTVRVISRPYYTLPQELCLFFDCFTETKVFSEGTATNFGLPIKEVAFEFITLLSVIAREPLMPLGLRRTNDRPIDDRYDYATPRRSIRSSPPPPFAVNSSELVSILKGFASASDTTAQSALAAAKFYHAALSLVNFDPSSAYVLLVSAMECLAGHHYQGKTFSFETIEKFQGLHAVLDEIAKCADGVSLINKLKTELMRAEYFLRQKFILLITDHLPEEFWEIPDELHPYSPVFPAISRDNFVQCLKDVYTARSKYVHTGSPFPAYIEFGLRQRHKGDVVFSIQELRDKKRYVPPFSWFERVVHLVLTEYLRRTFAPDVIQARKVMLAEKEHLVEILRKLPDRIREDLESLTRWTAQFLGYSVGNPHAPNKEWARDAETVRTLREAGLIGSEDDELDGSSWLRSRDIGEIVGEFFFGVEENPFRGNELLSPRDWDDMSSDPGRPDGVAD